jgi:hypothetical protein
MVDGLRSTISTGGYGSRVKPGTTCRKFGTASGRPDSPSVAPPKSGFISPNHLIRP